MIPSFAIVTMVMIAASSALAQSQQRPETYKDFAQYYDCLQGLWSISMNEEMGAVVLAGNRNKPGAYVFKGNSARFQAFPEGQNVMFLKDGEAKTERIALLRPSVEELKGIGIEFGNKKSPKLPEVVIITADELNRGEEGSLASRVENAKNEKKAGVFEISKVAPVADHEARSVLRDWVVERIHFEAEQARLLSLRPKRAEKKSDRVRRETSFALRQDIESRDGKETTVRLDDRRDFSKAKYIEAEKNCYFADDPAILAALDKMRKVFDPEGIAEERKRTHESRKVMRSFEKDAQKSDVSR